MLLNATRVWWVYGKGYVVKHHSSVVGSWLGLCCLSPLECGKVMVRVLLFNATRVL
jgi:hypothetical protein